MPAPSLRRTYSTGTRVPRMTGLPSMISGFISMRSCGMAFSLIRFRSQDIRRTKFVSDCASMPSTTYAVFRNAILAEQQVVCTYGGRSRELCPHVIGTTQDGEETALALPFG